MKLLRLFHQVDESLKRSSSFHFPLSFRHETRSKDRGRNRFPSFLPLLPLPHPLCPYCQTIKFDEKRPRRA